MSIEPTEVERDNSIWSDYSGAGHDVESLKRVNHYRCDRCGAHMIDLSEDLAYGEMRKCDHLMIGQDHE